MLILPRRATRQTPGASVAPEFFGRVATYVPRRDGFDVNSAVKPAGAPSLNASVSGVFRVGPFGCEIAKTSGDFTNALTGLNSGSATYDSAIVVLGSSLGGGLDLALSNTAVDSGLLVSPTSIKLVASSSNRITVTQTVSPGDAIGLKWRDGDYAVWFKGVKYTDAGNFGNVRIANGLKANGDSFALIALIPDGVFSDGAMFAALENPWRMFTEPRRLWMPSVGAAPPAPVGTLGQFDPELRIAAWF